MSGLTDKITGRVKQAAGDLTGDAELRKRGIQEERKGDAKAELERANREADERAAEVARLERQTAGGGSHAGADRADAPGAAADRSADRPGDRSADRPGDRAEGADSTGRTG